MDKHLRRVPGTPILESSLKEEHSPHDQLRPRKWFNQRHVGSW